MTSLISYPDGEKPTPQELKAAWSAFNKRVHAEKNFDRFKELKKQNEANGLDPAEAKLLAAKIFPPPSMNDLTEELPLWGYRYITKNKDTREVRAKIRDGKIEDVLGTSRKAAATRSQLNDKDYITYLAEAVGPERRCSVKEAVSWVVANMLRPVQLIEPTDVPGIEAVVYLRECQNTEFRIKLLQMHMDKNTPSKQQNEAEQRFRDDKDRQLSLLEQFRVAQEGAENEVNRDKGASDDKE